MICKFRQQPDQRNTLKYLSIGHTFVSADTFHRKLEKELKKWNVFDFDNFEQCVKNGGDVIVMNCDDFFVSENWLCQSEESKLARPLLAYINIAEFCRGVT